MSKETGQGGIQGSSSSFRVLVFHRKCGKTVGTARISDCLKFACGRVGATNYTAARSYFIENMSKNRLETTQILL